MLDWKFTTIEEHGAVAVVTFNRGEALNAFNEPLVRELTAVAHSFYDRHDIHAVVLTGSPKAFSAGADLKERYGGASFASQRDRSQLGRRLCRAWEEMPQITVAAIEGLAVGAGVALAISCDWRTMAHPAYLYVPEVKIGLTLQWQAIPRLLSLVGPAKAKRIIGLCEKMPAQQALEWGLVDAVADEGEAVSEGLKLAEAAAKMPPEIVTMSKQAVNATTNALHHATSFMDSDTSLLVRDAEPARRARDAFAKGQK